jgi:hypothetical protein
MADDVTRELRDQLTLEAEWHDAHAARLDGWAADFAALGYPKSAAAVTSGAITCRQRAFILREIVAVTAKPIAAAAS